MDDEESNWMKKKEDDYESNRTNKFMNGYLNAEIDTDMEQTEINDQIRNENNNNNSINENCCKTNHSFESTDPNRKNFQKKRRKMPRFLRRFITTFAALRLFASLMALPANNA